MIQPSNMLGQSTGVPGIEWLGVCRELDLRVESLVSLRSFDVMTVFRSTETDKISLEKPDPI